MTFYNRPNCYIFYGYSSDMHTLKNSLNLKDSHLNIIRISHDRDGLDQRGEGDRTMYDQYRWKIVNKLFTEYFLIMKCLTVFLKKIFDFFFQINLFCRWNIITYCLHPWFREV